MAFEHLTNIYAKYYFSKKEFKLNPQDKNLKELYEKSKNELYTQIQAFEQYLDVIGNNTVNLIGELIKSKDEANSKMGVIREKVQKGWIIDWFNTQTLIPLGSTIEINLSDFDFIKSE